MTNVIRCLFERSPMAGFYREPRHYEHAGSCTALGATVSPYKIPLIWVGVLGLRAGEFRFWGLGLQILVLS